MASGKDYFFCEYDLDAVLGIIDADMFENDEDMESEFVTCIKNLPARENCAFKWEFCPKFCQGTRKQNIPHVPVIVSMIVSMHSTHDSVRHSDSGSSRSSFTHKYTSFTVMQKIIKTSIMTVA